MTQKSRFERLRRLSRRPYPAFTLRYAQNYVHDYPDHGPGWLELGITLVELARYEEAEQALKKALELCPEPKRQIPLSWMGHLFREAGDYNEAAHWYRKAIEADPHDATYHIFLGFILAKQDRFQEAEEAHRQATQCSEGCIDEAYLNLGFILRALGRYQDAAECFREAIRIDPHYRSAHRALRDVEKCIQVFGEHS